MSCDSTCHMNSFETVVIGTQTWAKRNYDFGGSYPNDDIANVAVYGKLYTWAEAMAIDIDGWHLPTLTEINTLISTVGGATVGGSALKEVGTTHWTSPNTNATNSSGFTAVGAGYTLSNLPGALKDTGSFWTATDDGGANAYYMKLAYNLESIKADATFSKVDYKLSVRLIKD